MKRFSLLFVFPILCLVLFPSMGNALGFEGFGGRVALVLPEDPIDNTIGFGAIATLGSIIPQMTALKAEVSADYWGKSYDSFGADVTFSSITLAGTVKYYFSSGGIMPFAGGGLGLILSRSSIESSGIPEYGIGSYDTSDSDTDIGFHLCGGVDIPMGPGTKITAEGRYSTDGVDVLQIMGAFVIKLK